MLYGFDSLSPDLVLDCAERSLGLDLESAVTPYNSYVNRVYAVKSTEGERFIIKFYRPLRWSAEAIAEEHRFVLDCAQAELPVVAPLELEDRGAAGPCNAQSGGISTLGCTSEGFLFAVYPFKSGRTFDLESEGDFRRLGTLIGRLHAVSRQSESLHRPILDPLSLTMEFCRALCASPSMHPDFASEFLELSQNVLETAAPRFAAFGRIRIHGDCHRGNILDRLNEGLLLIDFDDMMQGIPVQDLWLLLGDHMDESRNEMRLLLEGYTEFSPFDYDSLNLVETLRFMRILYFLSWVDRQKGDSGFTERYPDWGSRSFWIRELEDLSQQARYALAGLNA